MIQAVNRLTMTAAAATHQPLWMMAGVRTGSEPFAEVAGSDLEIRSR